jgi:hypothetical protein
MAEIPQHIVDDANSDIVDVIKRYIPLKKAGKNWSACCPFHNEKSPSFSVSPEKRFFYCFGCGAGGDAVKFVMDYESIDFRDAVARITGTIEYDGPIIAPKPRAPTYTYPPSHVTAPDKARDYLSRATVLDQHIAILRENTTSRGPCYDLNGSLLVPLHSHDGALVNLAAYNNSGVHFCAKGISFGATARMPAALNATAKRVLCVDYFAGWRLWWKLKGEVTVMAAIAPDNFIWMTRKMRDQFDAVALHKDDAEEYQELGFDVLELPGAY